MRFSGNTWIALGLTCVFPSLCFSTSESQAYSIPSKPIDLGAFQVSDAPNVLQFLPEVHVMGPRLLLGDIAEIKGPDAEQLRLIEIGETASFGLSKLLDVDRILSGPLAPWETRVKINGAPGLLKVRTLADTLPDSQIDSLLQNLMRQQAWKPGTEWEVHWTQKPKSLEVPLTPHQIELRFDGQKRVGKIPLQLRVTSPTGLMRRIPLVAEVKLWAPVAIASTVIHRGEKISLSSFKIERHDISQFVEGTLPDVQTCLGRLATVTLQPGRVLTLNVLDIPAMVKRGDRVPLIFEQGRVKVAVDAVARRDGRVGEIIPAFSALNRKVIRGEVREDGSLKWLPEGG